MKNHEKDLLIQESHLKYFSVMIFTVIMGVSGLALAFLKAHSILEYPYALALGFAYFDIVLFVFVVIVYLIKAICYPQTVKNEFAHSVQVNFFAAIAIAFLLISSVMRELGWSFCVYIWYAGAILEVYMTFYVMRYWINNNVEIMYSNPAWLIPVVGNIIVPLSGTAYVANEILFYFFTIGIFFWFILFTILLNRIIFHKQLPYKFIPTLFIFLAPPAAGMVSYVKITGSFDIVAEFLYNVAFFTALLLVFMGKNFIKIKFFISWWAFTFPLAAMALASILAYQKTAFIFYKINAHIWTIATLVVVIYVGYFSIKQMLKGEVFMPES